MTDQRAAAEANPDMEAARAFLRSVHGKLARYCLVEPLADFLRDFRREAREQGERAGLTRAAAFLEARTPVPPSINGDYCAGWYDAKRDYALELRAMRALKEEKGHDE